MASIFKAASLLGYRPYDALLSLSHAIFDVQASIEPSHPPSEISREKICNCLNGLVFCMKAVHLFLVIPISNFDGSCFTRIPSRHEIEEFQELLDSMFKTGNAFIPPTRSQILLLFEGYDKLLKGIEYFGDEDDYEEESELDAVDYAEDWEADHEDLGYTDDEN
jgi:hypothetical protein